MKLLDSLLLLAPVLLAVPAAAQQCCTGNVATYCTAGTSVQGCVPQIAGVGVPDTARPSGFELVVSQVPGQRTGLIFYGLAPTAPAPSWGPSSSSFLCVAYPIERTGVLDSGGSSSSCNGELRVDFNTFMGTSPAALGAPFVSGRQLHAQAWYRDPAAPRGTNLTAGLRFSLCTAAGDTTPPVITTCAATQTVPANINCQGVVPNFTSGVSASDSCGGAVTLSQVPAAGSITTSGLNSTVVTITATDLAGNTSSCTTTLNVNLAACQTPAGFVAIQPGTFQMGSNAATGAPYFNEYGWSPQPVHAVTISYPYWMGAKEVTQAQYAALMGSNPSSFGGNPNFPVERVSWLNASAYCAALTAQQAALAAVPAGYEYRLPTEAEWEYACRAGTTTEFNTGASLVCNQARFWYSHLSNSNCNNSPYGTGPVGSYAPNAWGLYDMHGNVWEWCLDSVANYPAGAVTDPFVTGGPSRVFRGGSWGHDSNYCRSAVRYGYVPGSTYNFIGFRVVLAPVLVP